MEVRSTQDGILRAFALLVAQQSNPRRFKQKRTYSSFGSAIHATRCLTKAEHKVVDDLIGKLKQLDPNDNEQTAQYQALLKDLSKQPVRFVPVKHEQRTDSSKSYPYRSTKRGG